MKGDRKPTQHSPFPPERLSDVLERVQGLNEGRFQRDVTPWVVPSAELLFFCGELDSDGKVFGEAKYLGMIPLALSSLDDGSSRLATSERGLENRRRTRRTLWRSSLRRFRLIYADFPRSKSFRHQLVLLDSHHYLIFRVYNSHRSLGHLCQLGSALVFRPHCGTSI